MLTIIQKEKAKAKALKEKEKAKALKDKEKAKAKALKEKAKAKALKEKEKAKALKKKALTKKKGGEWWQSLINQPNIEKYVFFSDEEGWGWFLKHYNDGKFSSQGVSGKIDDKVQFVFLGDSVDRGNRENELKMVKLLIDLQKENKMLLLAGNRDVNKMRLRYELHITITINGTEIDAYNYLHSITEQPTRKLFVIKVAMLLNKIDKIDKIDEAYVRIALAYQWLTRIDKPKAKYKVNIDLIDSAKWTYDDKIIKKYWGVAQKGGRRKKTGGAPLDDAYFTEKFNDQKVWFVELAKHLNTQDASRVTNLLSSKAYGIPANNENYKQWDVWAQAALDTPTYNGLYVRYLENCKPYHELEIGNYKLFCCHSAPNPKGVQSNWFYTDKISSTFFPIQRGDLFVNKNPTFDMCDTPEGCACKGKTFRDQNIIEKYEAYIKEATEKSPSDNEEILKLITLATGVRQDTELTQPVELQKPASTQDAPDYEAMQCFFSKDGILTQENLDKCFIVHGHQPFGIPYTSSVPINEGLNFKRVCVDVSRDEDGFTGDFLKKEDTLEPEFIGDKNWVYVTFTKEDSIFKARGMCRGKEYEVNDLSKIKITEKNYTEKYANPTLKVYPYVGLDNDGINSDSINKDPTKFTKDCYI
jgi:hypothetical protein